MTPRVCCGTAGADRDADMIWATLGRTVVIVPCMFHCGPAGDRAGTGAPA
jgi:hypothetical protein